jgi:hypothetical protein
MTPSFRGIEVGSNEGIEHFKRGGIMAKANAPGKSN